MNYAGCKRKFKVDSFVAKYAKYSGKATQVNSNTAGKKTKKSSPTSTTKRKVSTAAAATAAAGSAKTTTKKRKAPTSRKSTAFDRLQKKLNKR